MNTKILTAANLKVATGYPNRSIARSSRTVERTITRFSTTHIKTVLILKGIRVGPYLSSNPSQEGHLVPNCNGSGHSLVPWFKMYTIHAVRIAISQFRRKKKTAQATLWRAFFKDVRLARLPIHRHVQ